MPEFSRAPRYRRAPDSETSALTAALHPSSAERRRKSGARGADLRLAGNFAVRPDFLQAHGFPIAIGCEEMRKLVLLSGKSPDDFVRSDWRLFRRRFRPTGNPHDLRRLGWCLRTHGLLSSEWDREEVPRRSRHQ